MKLQCACGAKYAFDATPEMLQQPVKFICPSCGRDSSEFVNQLIRSEFGGSTPAAAQPAAPSSPAGRVRVTVDPPPAAPLCAKHREPATEQCAVCRKPICPKCLELLGYFCSPRCKGQAEAQQLAVPEYAGRKDLVEAKFWRRVGLVGGLLGLLLLLGLGTWIWYAWFGAVPHTYFSVRFADENRGYYGHAQLAGQDQIVFLHGGTLARYNLKTKQPVWSQELISPAQIEAGIKAANEEQARMNEGTGLHSHSSQDDIARGVKQALQSELALHVSGQNVWVARGNQLTRYDWESGKVARQVSLPERGGELMERGDELQWVGPQSVTHLSLASGESRVEWLGAAGAKPAELGQTDAGGGLPGASAGAGKLDPKQVEAQAQNLRLQGKIALPALLSNARHEQQLEQALQDDPQSPRRTGPSLQPDTGELFRLVAGPNGFVRFSWHLLEAHLVTRSALKAPAGKSALDGDLNATKTTAVANEILNEMQRNSGGDTVTEDESRYQVTVHLPGAAGTADWSGEIVGPPQLFALNTVNVIAAGKNLVVLEPDNHKRWQANLTYPVAKGEDGASSGEDLRYGAGPCVERGETLYVFDQAMLTAFDSKSGNARWRLPSVGVVGLFFDAQDNVYVNTTTGNPDEIKYSRQIDISRRTEAVVSKIDPKTGKTLWSVKPGGFISYLSGPFIYVVESYDPNPTDADVLNDMTASLQKPAYLRIARLRPADGRVQWEYYDRDRCPVHWDFSDNTIELLFKREVQVLHYLTFAH